MKQIPTLAVTMGDPGGIGPRLIARAIASGKFANRARLLIFGDARTLDAAAALDGVRLDYRRMEMGGALSEHISELRESPIVMIELPELRDSHFERGRVSAANGAASAIWIEAGVRACLDNAAQALVTAPISKEAIRAAGVAFPGHTEMLAGLSGGCEVRMMLTGGKLRVVLETIHVALREVPHLIEYNHLVRSIELIERWSQRFLRRKARIGVCGLNPHAGENGEFGREEIDIIRPAIQEAWSRGIDASGPYPADTVFHRACRGEFDFVLAMYHDQGLAPLKTIAFETGVNVTIGLPFVRTSPDHGTAFDRAWIPEAPLSHRSFENALELALRWSRGRRDKKPGKARL